MARALPKTPFHWAHGPTLDIQLAAYADIDVDRVRQIRTALRTVRTGTLLRAWFGTPGGLEAAIVKRATGDYVVQVDASDVAKLRGALHTRRRLLRFVHGDDSVLARDLLYVRLPSSEKRRLVSLMVKAVRGRFPWMTSRLVHAMAFRPNAFGTRSKASSILSGVGRSSRLGEALPKLQQRRPKDPWGPLYRRVSIPKAGGKRHLWVPNPPLKRLQVATLGLIGPALERALLPCVHGARSGESGPTFRNAGAHLGKAYVATFDLKDFFPSTTVGDVIRGLQWARERRVPMVDSTCLPSEPGKASEPWSLEWTDDAMVLVGRLGTRRSRLPQGSPLSPLLASVAFGRFDEAIIRALEHEFGLDCVTYTRYFDDLTISLSAKGAKSRRLASAREVRERLGELVSGVLEGSNYRLNASKSRCSRIAQPREAAVGAGHDVTGLVVRADAVDLSRDAKRTLRTAVHRLAIGDFVTESVAWAHAHGKQHPAFVSVEVGHRWRPSAIGGRRCSAERLACLMLRRFHPEIRVRRVFDDWSDWLFAFRASGDTLAGKRAWPGVEWLLGASWSGAVAVRRHGENAIMFSQGSQDLCAVEAESPLGYLLLPKTEAIAVAEYWHFLRGMMDYLGACPRDSPFRSVADWHGRLAEAVARIEIRAQRDAMGQAGSPSGAEPLTSTTEIGNLARSVLGHLDDLSGPLGLRLHGGIARTRGTFARIARNRDEWDDWAVSVSDLFVTGMPHSLPPYEDGHGLGSPALLECIRLIAARKRGTASAGYRVVKRVEVRLGLMAGEGSEEARCAVAQRTTLSFLLGQLEAAAVHRDLHAAMPAERWRAELGENPWAVPIDQRIRDAVDRLERALLALANRNGERRMLDENVSRELARSASTLVEADARRANGDAWQHLMEVGRALLIVSREQVDPAACEESLPDDFDGSRGSPADWRRRKVWKSYWRKRHAASNGPPDLIWLVELFRHRAAHGPTPERRNDWVSIQGAVAGILGRDWESRSGRQHPHYHADDDLTLIGEEHLIVKHRLILQMCETAEAIAAAKGW